VATWDDVSRLVGDLPGVEVHAEGQWSAKVNGKALAWERPLRAADKAHLGDRAPQGDVLAVRVADEGVKQALVADDPVAFFTTPHFDGYPAVLAVLDELTEDDLREVLTEAWINVAPKRTVAAWLERARS
jgi:hypothetical protein